MAERGITIGTHAHPLVLVNPGDEKSVFVCARCKKQDNKPRYCCNTCFSYPIHVHCAVEIKKVEDKARQDKISYNAGIQVGTAVLGGLASAGVREGALAGIDHFNEAGASATVAAGAVDPSEAVAGASDAAADGAGAGLDWLGSVVDLLSNLL